MLTIIATFAIALCFAITLIASQIMLSKDIIESSIDTQQRTDSTTALNYMALNVSAQRMLEQSLRSQIEHLKQQITYLKKVNDENTCRYNSRAIINTVKKPLIYENEYDVNPYTYFTANHLYSTQISHRKRVVEYLNGRKKYEIDELLQLGCKIMNARRTKRVTRKYTRLNASHAVNCGEHFIDGITYTDPLMGTFYNLYFNVRSKQQQQQLHQNNNLFMKQYIKYNGYIYHKVTFMRPFIEPILIANEIISTLKEAINIILPINDYTLHRLPNFLLNLRNLNIDSEIKKKRVKLFIAFIGNYNEYRNNLKHELISKVIHVSNFTSNFSRVNAIQNAVKSVCSDQKANNEHKLNDCLLMFCDLNVVFTNQFLERCRLHASKSKKIYYPITFSLHDARNIKFAKHTLQSIINDENGSWMDFDYRITCQYKSDFIAVNGFNELYSSEEIDSNSLSTNNKLDYTASLDNADVKLYRKHLKSPKVNVIRATDPSIFHFKSILQITP